MKRWAKIDVDLFDHPKVMSLSPKDQLVYIQIILYCADQKNDGVVLVAAADRRWGKATMKRLVAARLIDEPDGDGTWDIAYRVHDYLDHQTASADIAEKSSSKAAGGRAGMHKRHHIDGGRPTASCGLCVTEGLAPSENPGKPAKNVVVEARFG